MRSAVGRFGAVILVALAATLLPPAVVAGALPGTPTNLAPDGDAVGGNPVLSWTRVSGATRYRVQASTSPTFTSTLLSEDTVNRSYAPAIELPTGTVYWRVAAIDASGLGSYATASFEKSLAAPVPTTPADGAQLAFPDDPPTFGWTPSVASKSYVVEVDDADDFIGATSYTTRNSSFTLLDLPPSGQDFFWRVRGSSTTSGSGVLTEWSATQSFQVTWNDAPLLVSPINGNAVTDVEFVWQPVEGATTYQINVNLAEDFSGTNVFTATGITGTRIAPTTTLDNTSYYWRVRAVDDDGNLGPWSASEQFTREWLSVPTLLSPAAGAPTSGARTFEWTPVDHASSYVLQAGSDINFSPGTFSTCTTLQTRTESGGGNPSCSLTEINGLSTYYWRVRAMDAPKDVIGLWSEVRTAGAHTFPTTAPGTFNPSTPVTRLLPENCPPASDCVLSASPTFTWEPAPGATRYILYVYYDANFTTVYTTRTIAGPTTQYTLPEELPDNNAGQSYYWHVRACETPSSCGPDPLGTPAPSSSFQKRSTPVTLLSPTNGASVADQPRFVWEDYLATTMTDADDPAPGTTDLEAQRYRIEVSTVSTFVSTIDEKVVDTPFYTPYGTTYPEGPLYWRVRALDGDGSGNLLTWSATGTFTKATPALVPSAPTNGANVAGIPTFRWPSQAGASRYVYEVYKNGDTIFSPANKVLTVNTPHTEHTPVGTLPLGTYAWRLRREDATNKDGPWSAPRTFTISQTPVTLLAPAAGTTQTGDDWLFSWNGVAGASSYKWDVSTSPTIATVAASKSTVMTAYAPVTALPEGTLYWRVTALNSNAEPIGTSGIRSLTRGLAYENTAAQLTEKWDRDSTAAASGGGFIESRIYKSSVKVDFTGTSVQVYGRRSSAGGRAAVYVDGVKLGTAEYYSSSTKDKQLVFNRTGLANTAHTIELRVLNTKAAASSSYYVRLDYVKAGAATIQESSGAVVTKFGETVHAGSHGGSFDRFDHVTDAGTPAYAKLTFQGTGVDWYGVKAASGGKADVYIDGVKKATVDLYSAATAYNTKVFTSAVLPNGTHTIEIRATGLKRSGAKGTNVFLDYLKVR